MTKYEWETELKKNIYRLPPDEIKRVLEYYGELFDDYAERGKRETEIIYEFGNPVDVADKILAEYYAENGVGPSPTFPPPPDMQASDVPMPPDMPPTFPPPARERTEARGEQRTEERFPPLTRTEQDFVAPDIENPAEREDPQTAHTVVKADADGKSGTRVAVFILLTVLTGGAFVIAAIIVWALLVALVVAGASCSLGGAYTAVISIGLTATSGGAGVAQLGMGLALAGVGVALTFGAIKLIKLCAKLTKKLVVGLGDWLTAKKESV